MKIGSLFEGKKPMTRDEIRAKGAKAGDMTNFDKVTESSVTVAAWLLAHIAFVYKMHKGIEMPEEHKISFVARIVDWLNQEAEA